MRLLSFFIFLFSFHLGSFAQSEVTESKMKAEDVVRLVQRRFPIRTRTWNFDSLPVWNAAEKKWTISIYQYKHSNRGQCKYTNGCTIVRHLIVVINDNNKKIISKNLNRSLFHNYE